MFATPLPGPDTLVPTRFALHRLAATVIAPVRHTATGRFGLIATPGGFGTPRFPLPGIDEPDSRGLGDTESGRQIRVEGVELLDDRNGTIRKSTITTLAAAAEFLETTIDPDTAREDDSPEVGDPNELLDIDIYASAFLGAWYNAAFDALERLRRAAVAVDPSHPQLWPGHFDPAIETGTEATRGSYGASPGDSAIPEPYLYVALWDPEQSGAELGDPFWNASTFTGRVLRLSDFPNDVEPADLAARFWIETAERFS